MPGDDEIRRRLVRHSNGPIEVVSRPDVIPDEARPLTPFYRPGLPKGYKAVEGDQLLNAHTSVDATADDIRKRVDAIWQSEPSVGVDLSPAQKHQWRKAEVKKAVEAELEGRMKLVRPVVERSQKELESRRGKLTAKGSVKLEGIPAQRALQIADHFAKLDPERRTLMAFEAMNAPDVPENRELLAALAWSHPSLELIPSDTRQRIQGVLVASSDPDEYAALVDYDTAVQATSESFDNLAGISIFNSDSQSHRHQGVCKHEVRARV